MRYKAHTDYFHPLNEGSIGRKICLLYPIFKTNRFVTAFSHVCA